MRVCTLYRLVTVLVMISIVCSCVAHYRKSEGGFPVSKTPQSLMRGKNLVFNICGQCHYDTALRKFTGMYMSDLPRFIGKIYSANLTASKKYGMPARYSDAELAYLLKTGVARDGRYVPYMIRPNLADEDINDILIYLRSGEDPVAAADTAPGFTRLNIFGKMAMRFSGRPLSYTTVKRPDEANMVGYGRYLVDNLACYHCHSKNITGLNYEEPEKSKGYMQGGMKFETPKRKVIYAPNLTPDSATGIGRYTGPAFRRALQKGIRPQGSPISLPMPEFTELTDQQCDAIFLYLRSLPPKVHSVKVH